MAKPEEGMTMREVDRLEVIREVVGSGWCNGKRGSG